MNIEFANTIPLTNILSKIGCEPHKISGAQFYYHFPCCDGQDLYLRIDTKQNKWFDLKGNTEGDVIAFVCLYLKRQGESHTAKDALRWLRNMMGYVASICPVVKAPTSLHTKGLKVKLDYPLNDPELEDYLVLHGICPQVAKVYLREVDVYDKTTRNTFTVFGMRNIDNGWELRNEFFRGTIGNNAITFIRGKEAKPSGVHIFHNMLDYLSLITSRDGKQLDEDVVVLHHLSNMLGLAGYFYQYGYKNAYTWMDNDADGRLATKSFAEYFRTQPGLTHRKMNAVYQGYRAVNAWHIAVS